MPAENLAGKSKKAIHARNNGVSSTPRVIIDPDFPVTILPPFLQLAIRIEAIMTKEGIKFEEVLLIERRIAHDEIDSSDHAGDEMIVSNHRLTKAARQLLNSFPSRRCHFNRQTSVRFGIDPRSD